MFLAGGPGYGATPDAKLLEWMPQGTLWVTHR